MSPTTLARALLSTVLLPASFALLGLRHLIAPGEAAPEFEPFEIDLELFSRNNEADVSPV